MQLKPLAAWCNAEFVEKRVARVSGDESKLYFDDGDTLDYDVLCLNVGSKTKDGHLVPGVYEHSLSTRPINELLGKIEQKEEELK